MGGSGEKCNMNVDMFVGEYNHSVDDKGRVAVPARYRNVLEGGAILTRGNDGCLAMFRMNEWEVMMEKIAKLPQSKSEARNYMRFVLSGAVDVKLDKQGRINIPKYLMDFGQIDKKVVFVGVFNRLEIWNTDIWDSYRNQIEGEASEVLEQLEEYGL